MGSHTWADWCKSCSLQVQHFEGSTGGHSDGKHPSYLVTCGRSKPGLSAVPAFPHVMPHVLVCLGLSWEHPLSISAIRQPSKSVTSWWKKNLLTENRDKERCTILWLWEQSLIFRGNTVKLVLFPKGPYLPKSPSYSRRQGPLTVSHPRHRIGAEYFSLGKGWSQREDSAPGDRLPPWKGGRL